MSIESERIQKRLADLEVHLASLRRSRARLTALPMSLSRSEMLRINLQSIQLLENSRRMFVEQVERMAVAPAR